LTTVTVCFQDWSEIDDLLQFASTADAAAVAGASGGNIEGGGISGIGAGTLLQVVFNSEFC
jgi:hypothetical protein